MTSLRFLGIMAKMKIVPITLKVANGFVSELHRHHGSVVGNKFSIGLVDAQDRLIGVAIIGRPVARALDQQYVAEVTRLCTDGTKNACSKLYSAAARICKEMGYHKIITYILEDEPGVSLVASGWSMEAQVKGRSWDTPSRRRSDKTPVQTKNKTRWAKVLERM